MKVALFSALALVSFGFSAQAGTLKIPVVASYQNLDSEKVWKGVDQDEVPLSAVQMREIQTPSRAGDGIFLQNDRMVVCYESCFKAQPRLPLVNGSIQLKDLDANKYISGRQREEAWKALKVLNVYYWTNQLFDYLETLGYKPSKRLTVIVDRNISDPTAGEEMNNNAFFTELDWSLNFLPVKNSIVYKALGMSIHSAALDPGVAMHECTHSVFQDLIGSILNPSLYGLHEALADYFAMAVMNTRQLGIIFFSGKPVRSAVDDNVEKKIVYEPGLEAHALGNIVNTALQHIRSASPQKHFADLVALETVKELGKAPYIQATQIQSTYMNSISEVAKMQNQQVSPQTLLAVNNFWKAYNIQAPTAVPAIPVEYFKANKNVAGYFELTTVTQFPAKTAADWHMPAKTSTKVGILNITNGPPMIVPGQAKPKETQIILAEVESDSVTTPIYLHSSKDGLLGAYDFKGQLIVANNPEQFGLFEKTIELNKALPALMELSKGSMSPGDMFAALFAGSLVTTDDQKMAVTVYKLKDQSRTHATVAFSSVGNLEVTKRTGHIDTTMLGKVFGVISGGSLRSVDEISVYTVSAREVPQLKTTEVFPGERLLGYEMRTQTGVVTKILITDFDGDPKSSVLAKKK
ncbi:MAG: hypothetical protein ACM3MG_10160 [Bacillota bacterium]